MGTPRFDWTKPYTGVSWYNPDYEPATRPFYRPTFGQMKAGQSVKNDLYKPPTLRAPTFAEKLFGRGVEAAETGKEMLDLPLQTINFPYDAMADIARPHLQSLAALTPLSEKTRNRIVEGTLLAAMIAAPGPGGKEEAAAKIVKRGTKASRVNRFKNEAIVRDVVAESKTPRPLAPAAGVSPVNPIRDKLPTYVRTDEGYVTAPVRTAGKKVYKVIKGELVEVKPPRTDAPSISGDAIPTTRRMTEGKNKRDFLEPAAKRLAQPSLPYIRQEMREAGYLPDPMAPRQLGIGQSGIPLPAGTGPSLRSQINEQVFPNLPGQQQRLLTAGENLPELPNLGPIAGGTRGPTDLPPMDLGSFYRGTPPLGSGPINLPSLGKKPVIPMTGTSVDEWLRPIESQLRADSPAASRIADRFIAYRTDKGILAGRYIAEYEKIVGDIKPKDWEQVAIALKTGERLKDPKLEKARKAMMDFDARIVNDIKSSGVKMKTSTGEFVPFVEHEGYWPQIYDKNFWKDPANVINLLMAKGYKEEEATAILSRAKDFGGRLLSEEAVKAAEMGRKFGTQTKGFQHYRQIDLPGYSLHPDAYKLHLNDVADRIAAERYLGDRDMVSGPINDLLKQTKQEARMRKLMRRVLGREGGVPDTEDSKFANAILTGESALHLSNFWASNPTQLALSGAKAPKAIPAGIASLFRRGKRLSAAKEAGALQPVHTDLVAGTEGLTNPIAKATNKLYGIHGSEVGVRSISSAMGQDEALRLHKALKKNPTSDSIRNRIEELTMTPANELLAQDSLTKLQLDRAGGRFSELTQGRVQSFDLPYHMTGGSAAPWKNVLTQFGKYGVAQLPMLGKAIRQKPITTGALSALGYYGASEALGAVKDAKRAAVGALSPNRDFADEWRDLREKRGPIGLDRVINTLPGSWWLGTAGNIAEKYLERGGLAAGLEVLPPVLSDSIKAADAARQLYLDNPKVAQNLLTSVIPYVGTDVANRFYPLGKKKTTGKKTIRVKPIKWR